MIAVSQGNHSTAGDFHILEHHLAVIDDVAGQLRGVLGLAVFDYRFVHSTAIENHEATCSDAESVVAKLHAGCITDRQGAVRRRQSTVDVKDRRNVHIRLPGTL